MDITTLESGKTGTGKSWLACRLAEDLDPTFNSDTLEERLVRKPLDFARLIKKEKEENSLKKGSVIIFDEAGTSISARRWQSLNNQAINDILQVFRFKNIITIFTLPDISFIDKNARRLLRYHIETRKINYSQNKVICKIFNVKTTREGDIYFAYSVLKWKDRRRKILNYRFKAPSVKVRHKYEIVARKLKDEIIEENIQKLEPFLEPEKKQPSIKEIIDNIKANREKFESRHYGKPTIPADRIRAYHNVGSGLARKIKVLVENELYGNKNNNENV